jgi:hypothetical protein
VLAAASGAPIAGVSVFSVGPRLVGATTGASGSFRLSAARSAASGGVRLVAARIGFAPETLTVAAGEDAIVFRLREAPLALAPAVVQVERSVSAASSAIVRALDIQLGRAPPRRSCCASCRGSSSRSTAVAGRPSRSSFAASTRTTAPTWR